MIPFCACGCGQQVSFPKNRYVRGHNSRKKTGTEYLSNLPDQGGLCACGCGQQIQIKSHHSYYGISKFIRGHNRRGKKQSAFWYQRIRESNGGRKHTSEHRRKNSVSRKLLWQDPGFVQKQMKARKVYPNKAEMFLQGILDRVDPGNWIYVGDGRDKQYILSGKVPDFVHRTKKLIIELFGDYWHKEEEIEPRTKLFEKHRYQTLIIWEHELQLVTSVMKTVQNFMELKTCLQHH